MRFGISPDGGSGVGVGAPTAVTVNDNDTVWLVCALPVPLVTVSTPLYVPAASPVLGRTFTVDEPPAAIVADGEDAISKFATPFVMDAVTLLIAAPELLMVTDRVDCAPYPATADGNVMLVGLTVHDRDALTLTNTKSGSASINAMLIKIAMIFVIFFLPFTIQLPP